MNCVFTHLDIFANNVSLLNMNGSLHLFYPFELQYRYKILSPCNLEITITRPFSPQQTNLNLQIQNCSTCTFDPHLVDQFAVSVKLVC